MVKERLSEAPAARPVLAWRSLLIVPAAAAEPVAAAGADAVVLTVSSGTPAETAQSAERLGRLAAALRRAAQAAAVLVAIPDGLDAPGVEAVLDAAMAAQPEALLLMACRCGCDVGHLAAKLAVREAQHDVAAGSTRIVAVAGAAAAAVLNMASYAGASRRLAGLGWDEGVLAAELGLDAASAGAEEPSSPLRLARGLTLLGARAAGVAAFDGRSARPAADFAAECRRARRDGFTGKLARDAAEVAIINATFGTGAARHR